MHYCASSSPVLYDLNSNFEAHLLTDVLKTNKHLKKYIVLISLLSFKGARVKTKRSNIFPSGKVTPQSEWVLSLRSDITVSVCWLTAETVKADQSLTVLELDSRVTRVNPLTFLQWLQTIGTVTLALSTSGLRWEGFGAHTSGLLWQWASHGGMQTLYSLSLDSAFFPFSSFTVAVRDSELSLRPPNRNIHG